MIKNKTGTESLFHRKNRLLIITALFGLFEMLCHGANCPNGVSDTEERTYTKTLSASGDLLEKINTAFKKIPKVEAEISSGSVTGSGTMKNCCNGDSEIVNGIKSVAGSVDITGTVSGNLYGDSFEYTKTGHIWGIGDTEFKVNLTLGVPLSVEVDSSASVGYVYNGCDSEQWTYGGFSVGLDANIQVTLDVKTCINIDEEPFAEADFNVTPASVDVACSGDVGYNTESSESGGYGSASVDNITFTASIDILGFSWSESYVVYEGGS